MYRRERRKKTPADKHDNYCMMCSGVIAPGEGGYIIVPSSYTGGLPSKTHLHNGCLTLYLRAIDRMRRPHRDDI